MDHDGRSTIAAAEGQAALAAGDTMRAREKFTEAGAALEKDIARLHRQSEKHFVRFLAATQHYKGGNYPKAAELCRKIEQRMLPPEVRAPFPKFAQDVKDRASARYEPDVRHELQQLWQRKQYDKIVQMLQVHPYVLPPGGMALWRAVVCERLGKYRAAAIFYADAIRMSPTIPNLIFGAASLPLTLPSKGRLSEAWEYVQQQLEFLPHPVTYAVASVLSFHRFSIGREQDRKHFLADQKRYFDLARAGYSTLSADQQANPEMKTLINLGFEGIILASSSSGDQTTARLTCEAMIKNDPNNPSPWTMRGIIRYPEAVAVEDFQKAISLGDDSYFPYYYLAHDALTQGDYPAASSYTHQALRQSKGLGAPIKSQLHSWTAFCRWQMGANRDEVEGLFRTALAIDPENQEVGENYRLFLDTADAAPAVRRPPWKQSVSRGLDDQFLLSREDRLARAFDRANYLPGVLQGAGV
jgi:tetratricopeptide (TPR) repeat protein